MTPSMKRHAIKYLEADEEQTAIWKGYDADHALERFWDNLADYGGCFEGEIKILTVTRYYTPEEMIQRRYNRKKVTVTR